MKNILIPTDFSNDSFQLIGRAAETLSNEKFNVILFHAFDIPSDLGSLMFLGRDKIYTNLVTDEFRSSCKKVKNLYIRNVNSISVRYMYGTSVRVFKNFADANEIDLIVLPTGLQLGLPHKYSYNPVSILRKSGVEILSSFNTLKPSVSIIRNEALIAEAETETGTFQYTKF